MPLVAHNDSPTFSKLEKEGLRILRSDLAQQQDIRELHIGLLNMMPDTALVATERQFFRLIGESNPIAQLYVHPFSIGDFERTESSQQYIDRYYESFEQIKEQGLDGLIITGANVIGPDLSRQVFWDSLKEVSQWAYENVTSTLCSCLATHAVMQFRYEQPRHPRPTKKWGVFGHQVIDPQHPLVVDINTRFDVPHSRWNRVSCSQFEAAGLRVLAVGDDDAVHLATSPDGFRSVFFQGHPEYDTISLLKEYKRDVNLYISGELGKYPPMPENYFGLFESAVCREYRERVEMSLKTGKSLPDFPENMLVDHLDNTWHDTASAVVGRWVGLIYQYTGIDRHQPFMAGVDRHDPLGSG